MVERKYYVVTEDSLPDVIKELIATSGLSQRKVCEKAGINHTSLIGYMRGVHSPSVRLLCYMLEVLGKELIIVDKK